MPKNKGKGGKKFKNKHQNRNVENELVFKEDG